ncbi:MAG: helix-turn-helix transcriptional regulator [Bacillota bacterium]|nr:helix-turn-helix transcriptional regulator [Bacillota bacterium]
MNKDVHILFGLRIKELRLKAHISQEELSFRCGLSKNYISDVERGTRNISLKAISKLAYGLHVEIKDLFTFSK